MMEHLQQTANAFWVAEDDDEVVGYARSLMRDDVWQLSEFFVRPGYQSKGLGRNLLQNAFPQNRGARRVIIATPDQRAMIRYLKSGVYPRFPVYFFRREPRAVEIDTDLEIVPLKTDLSTLTTLNQIDRQIVGYVREVDHRWWAKQRQGFLYLRDNKAVGYGYVGEGDNSGPFALRDANDFPAVLGHAENLRATDGGSFGFEVPLINRIAVNYLLENGFQMDSFYCNFMTDRPMGQYENYVFNSPAFFT